MKKKLTLLFLSFCTVIFAQSGDPKMVFLDSLYKEARQHYKKGCPEFIDAYTAFANSVEPDKARYPRHYARLLDLRAAKSDSVLFNVYKARAIRKQYLPQNDPEQVVSLLNILNISINIKNRDSCLAYFALIEDQIKITERLDSTYYANYLMKRAFFLEIIEANYDEAYQLRLEALHIQQSRDILDYYENISDMANNRFLAGVWQIADSLYLKAINFQKQISCKSASINAKIPNTMLNYIGFLSKTGNYRKAKQLHDNEIATFKHKRERYRTIGNILMGLKEYDAAINYFTFDIDSLPKTNSQIISKVGKAKALILTDKPGKIQDAKFILLALNEVPQQATHKAAILQNLGIVYYSECIYDTAKLYLKQSLQIRKEISGEMDPDYIDVLQLLGLCHYKMGDITESDSMLLLANSKLLTLMQSSLDYMTVEEAEYLVNKYKSRFDRFFQYVYDNYSSERPLLSEEAYNTAMTLKGFTIVNNRLSYSDHIMKPSLDTLLQIRRRIIRHELKEITLPNAIYTDLLIQRDILEKQLQKGKYVVSAQSVSWMALKQKLMPNEVAIEFLRIAQKQDSVWYYALIASKDQERPVMVRLCEERVIKNMLNKKELHDRYRTMYLPSSIPGRSFYELIWQPLEKYVRDYSTVYYVPAGLLHRFNFAGVASKSKGLLPHTFVRLWSTRTLLERESWQVAIKEPRIALFDNIDYGAGNCIDNEEQFNSLATDSEALKRFIRSYNISLKTVSSVNATEKRFYTEIEESDMLILYSHGEYISATSARGGRREILRNSINVLSRSFLAMANANQYLCRKDTLPSENEDGLLTAYEITGRDLSKASIILLIGCQSALGEELAYEGMFGLPRAFKMAGTKFVLATTDEVDKEDALVYVSTFFKFFQSNGWDVRKAFEETAKYFSNEFPEEPYRWAGFILFE